MTIPTVDAKASDRNYYYKEKDPRKKNKQTNNKSFTRLEINTGKSGFSDKKEDWYQNAKKIDDIDKSLWSNTRQFEANNSYKDQLSRQ